MAATPAAVLQEREWWWPKPPPLPAVTAVAAASSVEQVGAARKRRVAAMNDGEADVIHDADEEVAAGDLDGTRQGDLVESGLSGSDVCDGNKRYAVVVGLCGCVVDVSTYLFCVCCITNPRFFFSGRGASCPRQVRLACVVLTPLRFAPLRRPAVPTALCRFRIYHLPLAPNVRPRRRWRLPLSLPR